VTGEQQVVEAGAVEDAGRQALPVDRLGLVEDPAEPERPLHQVRVGVHVEEGGAHCQLQLTEVT